MFIASKYEEMYSPDVGDFVYITDSAYTKLEILQMELLIIRTLDFSFGRPLPLHFLRRYSKAGKVIIINNLISITIHLRPFHFNDVFQFLFFFFVLAKGTSHTSYNGQILFGTEFSTL